MIHATDHWRAFYTHPGVKDADKLRVARLRVDERDLALREAIRLTAEADRRAQEGKARAREQQEALKRPRTAVLLPW